jgi:glycosyl transferase family 1
VPGVGFIAEHDLPLGGLEPLGQFAMNIVPMRAVSEFAEHYFRRYCLPNARTGSAASVRPNWRSRIGGLSRPPFLERDIDCLIALNLRRIGGTIADAQDRLRILDSGLVEAIEEAIKRARFDLAGPLEARLAAALARRGRELTGREFHLCFQIVEETVQIRRWLKIFDVASRYPVLLQTDVLPESLVSGAVADLSVDSRTNGMQVTIDHIKPCRAALNANYANNIMHDRTQNALNSGCVVIVEDAPIHRRLFAHGKNALLFRYDDSLAECLDLVCNRPERAYEIAQAGIPLRDDPAVRFGGFENILALAWR